MNAKFNGGIQAISWLEISFTKLKFMLPPIGVHALFSRRMHKRIPQASNFGLNLAIFFAYIPFRKLLIIHIFQDLCKENGQIQTEITSCSFKNCQV